MSDENRGTMECPICGLAEPHHHNEREQAWYRLAQIALPFLKITHSYDSKRSYGGMAYACTYCDRLRGAHSEHCEIKNAIVQANALLVFVGGKQIDTDEPEPDDDDAFEP